MKKKKNLFIVILIPALLILGALLFPVYERYAGMYVLPCPIRLFTGILCPGCGGTHALSALRHWDIISAFRHNALVPVWLIILFCVWLEHLIALTGRSIKIIPASSRIRLTAVGIMILYVILRNL